MGAFDTDGAVTLEATRSPAPPRTTRTHDSNNVASRAVFGRAARAFDWAGSGSFRCPGPRCWASEYPEKSLLSVFT